MAVITIDEENNSVCVLVESDDVIHIRKGSTIEVTGARKVLPGKVFVNGEVQTLLVRGDR